MAVRIDRVTKTFGSHVAVHDLSLEVPTGTIYGFIGPNGSGKTTTLRMILHILHPDHGSIQVLGELGWGAANDRIGYLPEERGLYRHMKVREVLRFHAELKGLRHPGPAIDTWLQRLGLAGAGPTRRSRPCQGGLVQGRVTPRERGRERPALGARLWHDTRVLNAVGGVSLCADQGGLLADTRFVGRRGTRTVGSPRVSSTARTEAPLLVCSSGAESGRRSVSRRSWRRARQPGG